VGRVILIKRSSPVGLYRSRDDAYVLDAGCAFDADIFREAPDIIACSSAIEVGEEWDLPPAVVMAIYEQVTPATTN
jgi:hypothetical protein